MDVEAHTAGSSIVLIPGPVPADFDMEEYGRYEYREAPKDHPTSLLLDQPITGVDQVRWRRGDVGLRLRVNDRVVVIANEADEVFVSDGALPPDYSTAWIEPLRPHR